MKNFLFYLYGLVFFGVIIASCNASADITPGTLRVSLTDAPADYEALYIDIREVRVHTSENAEDNENGWIVINDQPVRVNLLDLTNGQQEILGEEELQPGRYNQIRLVLGPDNEIILDGESHELFTPSAQQSGLKLNVHADIESESMYSLLLDFDASRSVLETPAGYILKPVIRAANQNESGAISGKVEPAEASAWIYAITESDTLAGTKADNDGDFLIIGIPSGTYQISIDPADGYNPTVIPEITVTAPDTTVLGTIEL